MPTDNPRLIRKEPMTIIRGAHAGSCDSLLEAAIADNAALLEGLSALCAAERFYMLLNEPHPGQALLAERDALKAQVQDLQDALEVEIKQRDGIVSLLSVNAGDPPMGGNALDYAKYAVKALEQEVARLRRILSQIDVATLPVGRMGFYSDWLAFAGGLQKMARAALAGSAKEPK